MAKNSSHWRGGQSLMRIAPAGIVFLMLSTPAGLSGQQTAQKVAASASVSDRELQAFAKVYTRYHQLRESYGSRMAQTADVNEKARLESQGNAEVKALLETQGLTVAKYNQILATLNSDPALRQKALQLVQQERK